MSAAETIEMRFLADMQDLKSELAKMPAIGDRSAKRMVDNLAREYKRAAVEAKKSATAQATAMRRVEGGFAGVKKAGMALGQSGAVSFVDDLVDSARGLSAALGPVGGAAALAAVGVAGIGYAAFKIVDGADAARDALEAMGLGATISDSAKESLDAYERATDAAWATATALRVELAGLLAPAFTDLAEQVVGVADALGDVFSGDLEKATRAIHDLQFGSGTLGRTMAQLGLDTEVFGFRLDAIGERGRQAAAGMEAAGKAAADLDDLLKDSLADQETAIDLDEEAADAARKAAAQREAAARKEAEDAADVNAGLKEMAAHKQSLIDATMRLKAVTNEANADELSDEARIEAAYEARIAKIEDEIGKTGDLDALRDAAAAAEERRIRDLTDLETERREAAMEAAKEQAEATIDAIQTIMSNVSGAAGNMLEVYGNKAAALQEQMSAGSETMTDVEKAQLQQRIAEVEKQALKAFRVHQATQAAMAIMTSYAAAVQAFAAAQSLPPPFGQIVGATAAASALAFGLTQVAVIQSQPPPSFHVGGFVDEAPATLLRGEAVLSRRGRRAMGDAAIAEANRMGGQGSQVIEVVNVYDHRVFRPFLRDFAKHGGLKSYLPGTGRPIGHRAR